MSDSIALFFGWVLPTAIIAMTIAGIYPLRPGPWQHTLFYFIGSMIYSFLVIHFHWRMGEKKSLLILDRLKLGRYVNENASLKSPYDSLTQFGWLLFVMTLNTFMILFFANIGLIIFDGFSRVLAK